MLQGLFSVDGVLPSFAHALGKPGFVIGRLGDITFGFSLASFFRGCFCCFPGFELLDRHSHLGDFFAFFRFHCFLGSFPDTGFGFLGVAYPFVPGTFALVRGGDFGAAFGGVGAAGWEGVGGRGIEGGGVVGGFGDGEEGGVEGEGVVVVVGGKVPWKPGGGGGGGWWWCCCVLLLLLLLVRRGW